MSTWNWVWHIPNEIYLALALNRESAYVFWYLTRFYSFIGCGDFGATLNAVLPRGHAVAHFARFATGMNVVTVEGTGYLIDGVTPLRSTSPQFQPYAWAYDIGLYGQGGAVGAAAGGVFATAGAGGPGFQDFNAANFNPLTWPSSGNSNVGGQNSDQVKVMAFESEDRNEITVVAFTPHRNDGTGGHDAGVIAIELPAGFVADRDSAYLMRSHEHGRWLIEDVEMNAAGTRAYIELPRSHIVSLRFTRNS